MLLHDGGLIMNHRYPFRNYENTMAAMRQPLAQTGRKLAVSQARNIFITESARRKLLAAYAHVGHNDDEYCVPAFTIAESAIFIDAQPIDRQCRSRFNVMTNPDAAKNVLEQMQDRYGGKVRMSVTHCHQFGMPSLSGTDVAGFQRLLNDPLASKPFADGRCVPVLLINGSGRERDILAFWVTPEGFSRALLKTIPDQYSGLAPAWEKAPVALPSLPRDEVAEDIRRALGAAHQVKLGRSKTDGKIALLIQTPARDRIVARFANWPVGFPSVTVNGVAVGRHLDILRFVSLNQLCAEAMRKFHDGRDDLITLFLRVTDGGASACGIRSGADYVTNELDVIDAINWRNFVREVVAAAAKAEAAASEIIDNDSRHPIPQSTGARDITNHEQEDKHDQRFTISV